MFEVGAAYLMNYFNKQTSLIDVNVIFLSIKFDTKHAAVTFKSRWHVIKPDTRK